MERNPINLGFRDVEEPDQLRVQVTRFTQPDMDFVPDEASGRATEMTTYGQDRDSTRLATRFAEPTDLGPASIVRLDETDNDEVPARRADHLQPLSALHNLFLLIFLLIGLRTCGIYAFLQRGSGSSQAVQRARAILRGDYELGDLNNRDTVVDFLSGSFISSFLIQDTFLEACTFTEFYGPEYAYGRLSTLPSVTIRILGDDEDEYGCEAPFFSFQSLRNLDGSRLRGQDNCPTSMLSPEAAANRDPGAYIFATMLGAECPGSPSVPPVTLSGCDMWLGDPPNGYLRPPKETNLCPNNATFCEALVLALQINNRTLTNMPKRSFEASWEAYEQSTNAPNYRKGLKNAGEVDWYMSEYWPASMEPFGVSLEASGMFPVNPGDLQAGFSQKTYEGNALPYSHKTVNGAPLFFNPRNESCYDLFKTYGSEYADELSVWINSKLEDFIGRETPMIYASAYLPLATGNVVSMLYTFQILADGTYVPSEHVAVRSIEDSVSLSKRVVLVVLALCIVLTSCHKFAKSVWEYYAYFKRSVKSSEGKCMKRFRYFSKTIAYAITTVLVAFAFRLFIKIALTYGGDDNSMNKVEAISATCITFYMAIFVEELTDLFVRENASMFMYLSDMWNWVDLMTVLPGLTSFYSLIQLAEEVGQMDKYINKNAYPPFNAFRDETAFVQAENGSKVAALIGVTLFFTTFRLFKFLSIFPVLVVPFEALRKSGKEIGSFSITLFLFMLSFSFFFMNLYGGDIDAFSGFDVSLETLFEGAVNEMDDSIFDRLGELHDWTMGFGIFLTFLFRGLVTVSFMNMLITITMAWYGEERDRPESQKFLSPVVVEALTKAEKRVTKVKTKMKKVRRTYFADGALGGGAETPDGDMISKELDASSDEEQAPAPARSFFNPLNRYMGNANGPVSAQLEGKVDALYKENQQLKTSMLELKRMVRLLVARTPDPGRDSTNFLQLSREMAAAQFEKQHERNSYKAPTALSSGGRSSVGHARSRGSDVGRSSSTEDYMPASQRTSATGLQRYGEALPRGRLSSGAVRATRVGSSLEVLPHASSCDEELPEPPSESDTNPALPSGSLLRPERRVSSVPEAEEERDVSMASSERPSSPAEAHLSPIMRVTPPADVRRAMMEEDLDSEEIQRVSEFNM